MEEPSLVSAEYEWSIKSVDSPSESCLVQDVPLHDALERGNHRLQLEVEELRVQLAQ